MIWIFLAVAALMFCFGGILLVGPPYLPTLSPQVRVALKMANLKPDQTLLELGCGDGKVVIAAAKQGINVVGFELNPIMAFIAWVRTRRYRDHVTIIWGNFWKKSWPPADAIFVFILPKYMSKLHKKCAQYEHHPVRLVSFAFPVPEKKPARIESGIYLYNYR